jgi:Zn finger protein HypA/HybF involved in hydrogenase expression
MEPNMRECQTCKTEIAKTALACPKCGGRVNAGAEAAVSIGQGLMALGLAGLAVYFLLKLF